MKIDIPSTRRMSFLFIFIFISSLIFITKPISAYADTYLENEDLVRIITVLNSLTPIIKEAERQQNKNTRVQFQYATLQSDINKIKTGIEQKLKTTSIEPRIVSPIQGDYLIQRTRN